LATAIPPTSSAPCAVPPVETRHSRWSDRWRPGGAPDLSERWPWYAWHLAGRSRRLVRVRARTGSRSTALSGVPPVARHPAYLTVAHLSGLHVSPVRVLLQARPRLILRGNLQRTRAPARTSAHQTRDSRRFAVSKSTNELMSPDSPNAQAAGRHNAPDCLMCGVDSFRLAMDLAAAPGECTWRSRVRGLTDLSRCNAGLSSPQAIWAKAS
jgi:hypothetical protein